MTTTTICAIGVLVKISSLVSHVTNSYITITTMRTGTAKTATMATMNKTVFTVIIVAYLGGHALTTRTKVRHTNVIMIKR